MVGTFEWEDFNPTRRCPNCRGTVLQAASNCRFCRQELLPYRSERRAMSSPRGIGYSTPADSDLAERMPAASDQLPWRRTVTLINLSLIGIVSLASLLVLREWVRLVPVALVAAWGSYVQHALRPRLSVSERLALRHRRRTAVNRAFIAALFIILAILAIVSSASGN